MFTRKGLDRWTAEAREGRAQIDHGKLCRVECIGNARSKEPGSALQAKAHLLYESDMTPA